MAGDGSVSVGMSLVINIGFWFERIPSVYAGSGRVKSTKSSSKSSSTEGRAGRFGEIAEKLPVAVC